MEFREIYCNNCKKVLGRYNRRYFTDDKIGELLKTSHASHVREGHVIKLRRVTKKS